LQFVRVCFQRFTGILDEAPTRVNSNNIFCRRQILKMSRRYQSGHGRHPEARKAQQLAQDYLQRKPGAIKVIDKLLASAGSSIDALMVQVLPGELDKIERIDRLATIAETRRNAMLREIDRRRAVLGEALRRQVQEVEGEFKVIEKASAETKSAA
jgi:hypothetical protein